MYKLIALDMDGTLLSNDKSISKKNIKAIKDAKAVGKKVVIATGRPFVGLKKYIELLEMYNDDDYVISFNGAMVQELKSGEVISNISLETENYEELYALSKNLGVHIHALTEHYVTTPIYNEYTEVEGTINDIPIIVRPVNEFPKDETVIKVMFVDDPEKLDKIVPLIPESIREHYSIVRSADIFLEFLDKQANKGSGVSAVARALDISQEEIICVGDAGNDLAMIEYAGLGVAMGNAHEEIKDIADYVTGTNDEDGVAQVISRFMLGDKVS